MRIEQEKTELTCVLDEALEREKVAVWLEHYSAKSMDLSLSVLW